MGMAFISAQSNVPARLNTRKKNKTGNRLAQIVLNPRAEAQDCTRTLWDLPAPGTKLRLSHNTPKGHRNTVCSLHGQNTLPNPQQHSCSNCCQLSAKIALSVCKWAQRWKPETWIELLNQTPQSEKILLKRATRAYIITGYIPTADITAQLSTKVCNGAKSSRGLKAQQPRDGNSAPIPWDWNRGRLHPKQKSCLVFSKSGPEMGKGPENFWRIKTNTNTHTNTLRSEGFFPPGIDTPANSQ